MSTIEVYCDDPSHGGREPVAQLRRGERIWEDMQERPARGARHPSAELVVQFVAEDHPVTGQRYSEPLFGRSTEPATVRYRLECTSCGLTVVLRGEKVVPIFDRLAAAGQGSVTLRGLNYIK
ncbi:MAG: hypothetical protein ACRDTS_09635 [Mycobacterium sp.]